jgi:hypothetical protein
MQRKTDIHDLDIPADDIECWEKYPKHHWVYDLSRLLDAQNIKWSPYEQPDLHREVNMKLESHEPVIRQPGFIYIKKPEGRHMFTEVYIAKGEVKHMRHIDPETGKELPTLIGEIELRLSAFITLHFVRFTGVITAETYSNEIHRIRLRPHSDLGQEENANIVKIAKRIYKKNEITLSGLTDRTLHATLAS